MAAAAPAAAALADPVAPATLAASSGQGSSFNTAAVPAAAVEVPAAAEVPATAQSPVTAEAPAASEMHGKREQQEEVHAHRGDGGWWTQDEWDAWKELQGGSS